MAAAKQINAKDLARELKQKTLRRAYLFLGEEEGLKERMIDSIHALLSAGEGPDSVVTGRFHAEAGDLSAAAEFALTASMFSPKKLAVIYEADAVPAAKQTRAMLEDFFGELPDSTTLVLATTQNKLPKTLPLEKLPDLLTVRFWRYFDSDMAAHVREALRARKMTVTDGAVALLMKLVGRDLNKMDEALERLSFSGQSAVTEDLVKTFIDDARDTTVFEFLDALFLKSPRALPLLKTLLDGGTHELAVLAMITRQCEFINRYHRLLREGGSVEEILKGIGIQERNRESFIAQAGKFGPGEVRRAFAEIFAAESALKGASRGSTLVSNPVFTLAARLVLPEGKAFGEISL